MLRWRGKQAYRDDPFWVEAGSELHGAALPGPAYRERYRTWAYVAINLSWRFDPIPAAECAALRARFSELRSARLRKVAELSIAWERAAEARAVASRIGAAVAARVELERIGALIEVTSGNQLQTKERE